MRYIAFLLQDFHSSLASFFHPHQPFEKIICVFQLKKNKLGNCLLNLFKIAFYSSICLDRLHFLKEFEVISQWKRSWQTTSVVSALENFSFCCWWNSSLLWFLFPYCLGEKGPKNVNLSFPHLSGKKCVVEMFINEVRKESRKSLLCMQINPLM